MTTEQTIEQLQARLKESEATNQLLHEAMVSAEKRGVDKGKEESELRIKELEASAAAMRAALQHFTPGGFYVGFDDAEMVKKALSTLAGKEYFRKCLKCGYEINPS